MATKVSALKAATRKADTSTAKTDPRIIVASEVRDFRDPDKVLYTKDQVVEAIDGWVEGDRLEKQSKSLKKLHEPTIDDFALYHYAKRWAAKGTRPDNPKLVTQPVAGSTISYSVKDQERILADDKFAQLANLIGATAAEENTVKRDEISFNQDKLEEDVGGQTVLEHIDAAISDYFDKLGRSDVLEGLFEIKPKFTTKKGLIDKGLGLVGGPGPDAARKLREFIDASMAPTAMRADASGK
jgi:hypothetical protein